MPKKPAVEKTESPAPDAASPPELPEPPKPPQTCRIDLDAFRRIVKTVLPAVSTDETRAHLNAMHFVCVDGKLTIEGTDGHMLAQWRDIDADGDLDALVPRLNVQAFLRLLTSDIGASRNLELFTANHVELFAHGSASHLHHALAGTVPFIAPDVAFPPVGDVIPKSGPRPTSGRAAIASEYLKRAGDIFKYALGETVAVGAALSLGNELDAVVFSNEVVPSLVVVVMPMRLDAAA